MRGLLMLLQDMHSDASMQETSPHIGKGPHRAGSLFEQTLHGRPDRHDSVFIYSI